MTEQLTALNTLMAFGEKVISEDPDWDTNAFREEYGEFLTPSIDDWECVIIRFCTVDLLRRMTEEMAHPSEIYLKVDGPCKTVMERYFRISWEYITKKIFEEDIPFRMTAVT